MAAAAATSALAKKFMHWALAFAGVMHFEEVGQEPLLFRSFFVFITHSRNVDQL